MLFYDKDMSDDVEDVDVLDTEESDKPIKGSDETASSTTSSYW